MFAGAVHRAFAAAAEARGGARRAFCWLSLSYFGLTLAGRTPGRCRNSRRASGVLRASAAGGFGPRDPLGRKNSATSTALFWFRAAASGPGIKDAPPQARRFYEPHYSLSVQAVEAYGVWGRGWQQKTLCVPPRSEASARAALRAAGARLQKSVQTTAKGSTQFFQFRAAHSPGRLKAQRVSPHTTKGRNNFLSSSACRPPPRRFAAGRTGRRFSEPQEQRPILQSLFSTAASGERILRLRRPVKDAVRPLRIRGLRADRYHGDLELFALGPKLDKKHGSTHRPNFRPKQAQPSPVLCPVSASLRLRFRSAAFASPAGISSRFC